MFLARVTKPVFHLDLFQKIGAISHHLNALTSQLA